MTWPLEASRETDEGIIISEAMDWCRSPTAIVPYRLYAYQSEATALADSVRQTDDRTHVKASVILKSYGDEPGVGGGVKSGTHNAECTPKTWSESVRAEGRNVVRHDDEWWMNRENTWGRLNYVKDSSEYSTPSGQDITSRMSQQDASLYQASYTDSAGSATYQSASGDQQAQGLFFRPMPAPEIGPELEPFLAPRVGPRLAPQIPPRFAPDLGPEPGPEPKPLPDPPPPPPPGFRNTGCRSELICFENTECKFDETEYRKQLKIQQRGLNAKTACQNAADIKKFDDQSPAQKAAQRGRADYYKNNTFLPQYAQTHPTVSLANKDALHRIDMVAGGYEKDFADVGNSGVNRSIGGEWPADSRKGKLRRYVAEMCEKGCRMSVTLDICETPIDPAYEA